MAITWFSEPPLIVDNATMSSSTWTAVDLSAHVPAGATAAIMMTTVGGGLSSYMGFASPNAVSLNSTFRADASGGALWITPVVGQQIQHYRSATNGAFVYLMGYMEAEAVLFDDPVRLTQTDQTVFETHDISANITGGDTAVAAIVLIGLDKGSTSYVGGRTRPVGDTTTLEYQRQNGCCEIVHLNASNQFEGRFEKHSTTGAAAGWLVGYIKNTANLTFTDAFPAYDINPSTIDTWEASTGLPADATGIFAFHNDTTLGARNAGLRPAGSVGYPPPEGLEPYSVMATGCNGSGQVEAYTNEVIAGRTWGTLAYTTGGGSPPGATFGQANAGKPPTINTIFG